MTIKPLGYGWEAITVELSDGRWQRFKRSELEIVREFALTSPLTEEAEPRIWRLLAFITSLSPLPEAAQPPSEEAGAAK